MIGNGVLNCKVAYVRNVEQNHMGDYIDNPSFNANIKRNFLASPKNLKFSPPNEKNDKRKI